MTRAFALEARLAGPVVLRGLLHLDGLVAAGRYLLTDDAEDLTRPLPFARVGSCYAASAAFLEVKSRGAALERITRIKSVRPAQLESEVIDPGPNAAVAARRVGPMSPYRGKLNTYPSYERVLACWWTGRGDPAACFEAVRHLRHLGAMARTGHGPVIEWHLHRLEDDPWAGIRGRDGRPLRAIPLDEWHTLSGSEALPPHAVIGRHRPMPPYWEPVGSTVCVMPARHDTILTRGELESVLGAKENGLVCA